MNKPLDVDGDCVERGRVGGAVGAMCEMLHGHALAAPDAPSDEVAPSPSASSAPSSSSSAAPRPTKGWSP